MAELASSVLNTWSAPLMIDLFARARYFIKDFIGFLNGHDIILRSMGE